MKMKCARVFVDRNEIHFDSAEHSVLDEEPLNSAEYAHRSKPFRNDSGLGESGAYRVFNLRSFFASLPFWVLNGS